MAKRYSEEYKKNLVAQYKTGISVQNICVRHGIARSTLFLWVKQYTADADGRIPREQYLLQKELEQLRTENAIFRSCGCSPSAPLAKEAHMFIPIFRVRPMLVINFTSFWYPPAFLQACRCPGCGHEG